jgi:hypothetical protein
VDERWDQRLELVELDMQVGTLVDDVVLVAQLVLDLTRYVETLVVVKAPHAEVHCVADASMIGGVVS